MGMAMRGLTHCRECGTTLGMGELGTCDRCTTELKQKEKEKTMSKKIFKGYELIKEIAEGNIKERNKI